MHKVGEIIDRETMTFGDQRRVITLFAVAQNIIAVDNIIAVEKLESMRQIFGRNGKLIATSSSKIRFHLPRERFPL